MSLTISGAILDAPERVKPLLPLRTASLVSYPKVWGLETYEDGQIPKRGESWLLWAPVHQGQTASAPGPLGSWVKLTFPGLGCLSERGNNTQSLAGLLENEEEQVLEGPGPQSFQIQFNFITWDFPAI